MPLIEYTPRDFKSSSLEVIDRANGIIADYESQGLTLTLRQLYYRFVAADAIPNTERSYDRLGKIINNARLAGLVDWCAIEDRGRSLMGTNHHDDPADLIKQAADDFALNKWKGQPWHVEVWVEKQALEAVVGQAAQTLDVDFFSCKGYVSQSEMWRASLRFQRHTNAGRRVAIVHLGDHDPSGIDMTRDIRERLNDVFCAPVELNRIALNMGQIEEYNPPPNPAKVSDSRAPEYIARYGTSSWELDALEPRVLNELIVDAINEYRVPGMYDGIVALERRQRATLEAVAAEWAEVELAYGVGVDDFAGEEE